MSNESMLTAVWNKGGGTLCDVKGPALLKERFPVLQF